MIKFFAGMGLGVFIGVFIMCALLISRDSDDNE